jgi:hypothetical protein
MSFYYKNKNFGLGWDCSLASGEFVWRNADGEVGIRLELILGKKGTYPAHPPKENIIIKEND